MSDAYFIIIIIIIIIITTHNVYIYRAKSITNVLEGAVLYIQHKTELLLIKTGTLIDWL